MQCENPGGCSIMQTAPYKRMMTALLLRLNGVISFEEEIKIYLGHNAMSIVMKNDAKTVEIRSRENRIPEHTDETAARTDLSFPIERKRRKYAKQRQEDLFVSNYLSRKTTIVE